MYEIRNICKKKETNNENESKVFKWKKLWGKIFTWYCIVPLACTQIHMHIHFFFFLLLYLLLLFCLNQCVSMCEIKNRRNLSEKTKQWIMWLTKKKNNNYWIIVY